MPRRLLLALCSLALAACNDAPVDDAPGVTRVPESEQITEPLVCEVSPESNEGEPDGQGSLRPPMPVVPEPTELVEAPPSDPEPRKVLGTFNDWLKAYNGMGGPDTNPPPPLGTLSDLPALPSSTLVYRKSGHLVRVSLPSGKQTPLSSGAFADSDPVFTRDGKHLFFRSNRDGAVDRIFRMRFPDGEPVAVTGPLRTGTGGYTRMRWAVSAQGDKIAVIPNYPEIEGVVTLVDVVTGKSEVVFRGDFPDYPTFSSDGRLLYFAAGGVMAERLHAYDLHTKTDRTLPSLKFDEVRHPVALSSDKLLFSASRGFSMADRDAALYTMPREGGAWTRVGDFSAPTGYMTGVPSPDGKKIAAAWSRRVGGFGADWHADVTILTADGQHLLDVSAPFPRPFYGASDPSWAPDSRHVALELGLCPYLGCELSQRWVVLADTSQKRPKLVYIGDGSGPVFRPGAGD